MFVGGVPGSGKSHLCDQLRTDVPRSASRGSWEAHPRCRGGGLRCVCAPAVCEPLGRRRASGARYFGSRRVVPPSGAAEWCQALRKPSDGAAMCRTPPFSITFVRQGRPGDRCRAVPSRGGRQGRAPGTQGADALTRIVRRVPGTSSVRGRPHSHRPPSARDFVRDFVNPMISACCPPGEPGGQCRGPRTGTSGGRRQVNGIKPAAVLLDEHCVVREASCPRRGCTSLRFQSP